MSAITALPSSYQQPPSGRDDPEGDGKAKLPDQGLETVIASAADSVQLSPLVMESLNALHQFEASELSEYEKQLSKLAINLKNASYSAYLDAYSTPPVNAYI